MYLRLFSLDEFAFVDESAPVAEVCQYLLFYISLFLLHELDNNLVVQLKETLERQLASVLFCEAFKKGFPAVNDFGAVFVSDSSDKFIPSPLYF